MWPQEKCVLGLIHREDSRAYIAPRVGFPGGRESPFQLAIDRRLLNIQTSSSYQLRAVLGRRGGWALPMFTEGTQPAAGVTTALSFPIKSQGSKSIENATEGNSTHNSGYSGEG